MNQHNENVEVKVQQTFNEQELILLKEFTELSEKYENLRILYENSLDEVKILQEVIKRMENFQKISTEEIIRHEESLLNETSALEISLNLQMQEIENEKHQLRRELERLTDERDQLIQRNSEIIKDKCKDEKEILRLKVKLSEQEENEEVMRKRFTELENEYHFLQKKEFFSINSNEQLITSKTEIAQLMENIECLQMQIDNLQLLLNMANKQIEELQESLLCEREDKTILKNELEMYKNPDSLSIITTNLAESIKAADQQASSFCFDTKDRKEHCESLKIYNSIEMFKEFRSMTKITHIFDKEMESEKDYKQDCMLKAEFKNLLQEGQNLSTKLDKCNGLQAKISTFTCSVPDILLNHQKTLKKNFKNKSLSESKMLGEFNPKQRLPCKSGQNHILKRSLSNRERLLRITSDSKTEIETETEKTFTLEELKDLRNDIRNIKDTLKNNMKKITTLDATNSNSKYKENLITLNDLYIDLNTLRDEIVNYLNLNLFISNHYEETCNIIKNTSYKIIENESKENEITFQSLKDLETKKQNKRQRKTRKIFKHCWRVITCSTKIQKNSK